MREQPKTTPEREAYYRRISDYNLAPLWEALKTVQAEEPDPPETAVVWHYDDIRAMLLDAAHLISTQEANRHVLVLENPTLRGQTRATHSLYAGLQLVMPGETAPSHRHSQAAIRFIVEGEGAYTSVNGERTNMREGDFVVTPAWSWHDHGNPSQKPMVWMDGLDFPLVGLLNCGFFEDYGEDAFPLTRPENDSQARYSAGMLPVGYREQPLNTPLVNYPYARARESLERLKAAGPIDPCHGVKMRYVNPATGGYALATIGTFMQVLPAGFSGRPYRSTDAAVYSVVEGSGKTVVAGRSLEWSKRDVFVVPSWSWHYHEAFEESVIFSFSDRPVHETLGLFREQRGEGA